MPARSEPRPDDWELLGVEPGTPVAQIAAAYRRRRAVYSQGALASYMLLEDDERKALLARLDEAWERISTSTASAAPKSFRGTPEPSPEAPREEDQVPDPEQRPGAYLRAQRRLRGISLEAVSAETKIRPSLLQSLEEDRVEELPAAVFVRGFVVQFARMLGLSEPERLAELYLRRLGPKP